MRYEIISKKSDTWHWTKCSHVKRWLKRTSFFSAIPRKTWLGKGRPPSGELCNECLAREKRTAV